MSPLQDESITETFRSSADLSDRLNRLSQKYDISKSTIIRDALEMRFAILESLEESIRHAIISDFVKQSTKSKR